MPDATSAALRATAALALADGTLLVGRGLGARGTVVGEMCFNTAMTGYQEVLTDPSYAGQIITFTFPHIGNVGTNDEDVEAGRPAALGLIVRSAITAPSNHRATSHLEPWLVAQGLVGAAEIDTRRLTRHIRMHGFQNAALWHGDAGALDGAALLAAARAWGGIEGADLAPGVTCAAPYRWDETKWTPTHGFGRLGTTSYHVVALDFGAKRNILRTLAATGCAVTVMPAQSSAREILALRPDGIFLSNGPGDPAATGRYAVPVIRDLVASEVPVFGICLGHQLLALALGARTLKMANGHHGANHPVQDIGTGQVEITSQNHGFVVDPASLPAGLGVTHVSLFDRTVEGLRVEGKPVFSVQYHPEASPGPHDSAHLFDRFVDLMAARA